MPQALWHLIFDCCHLVVLLLATLWRTEAAFKASEAAALT
jgi:hypothetical protein